MAMGQPSGSEVVMTGFHGNRSVFSGNELPMWPSDALVSGHHTLVVRLAVARTRSAQLSHNPWLCEPYLSAAAGPYMSSCCAAFSQYASVSALRSVISVNVSLELNLTVKVNGKCTR